MAIKREDEEQCIRKRLIYDGHGRGEDKKLLSIIRSITKLCLSDLPQEEIQKIIRDIDSLLSAAELQLLVSSRCHREVSNLEKGLLEEEKRKEEILKHMANLKLEMEYADKLASLNKFPDCPTAEREIENLVRAKEKLQEKVAKHQRNLETVFAACENLRKVLEDNI